MKKNAQYIDKLRFRLFEIGLQLTEAQAEFEIAKAKQSLKTMNVIHSKKTAPYGCQSVKENFDDELILKQAFSAAYKAYLPKDPTLQLNHLDHIELAQLALPSSVQTIKNNMKYPFDLREFLQFSSQFQAKINLLWCGINKNFAQKIDENYLQFLWTHFPEQMLQWHSQLQVLRFAYHKEYVPFILHPWQFKHEIIKHLKEFLHEKVIIGPLTKQVAYPSFNSNTLVFQKPHQPLLHTTLGNISSYPNVIAEKTINKILTKEKHFKQSFFCLFSQSSLEFKNTTIDITTNFTLSGYSLLTSQENLISLNSLINANALFKAPLLINLFPNDEPFLLFFKRLIEIYYKPHRYMLKHHHLRLKTQPENLLLAFNGNQLTKVMHEMPSILFNQKDGLLFEMKIQSPLKKILNCYLHHRGNGDTYRRCLAMLPERGMI